MPRACGDSINAVYWQKYQGAIWQEQTESEAEQTMWEKIKYGLSQMAARGCACMLAVLVLVAAGSTDSDQFQDDIWRTRGDTGSGDYHAGDRMFSGRYPVYDGL